MASAHIQSMYLVNLEVKEIKLNFCRVYAMPYYSKHIRRHLEHIVICICISLLFAALCLLQLFQHSHFPPSQ